MLRENPDDCITVGSKIYASFKERWEILKNSKYTSQMDHIFYKLKALLTKNYPNTNLFNISEAELNLVTVPKGFYLGVERSNSYEVEKLRSFLFLMGACLLTTIPKNGSQVLVYFIGVNLNESK